MIGATASAPVFQPLQWAAVNQARDRVAIATESAAEVRRQVAMRAAQAYLAVIAGRRQLGVDARALEAARAHLDYATRRLEGGLGSRRNQVRAAQAVSENEARLETPRLAVRRAQEALGVILVEPGPVDAGADPAFEHPAPGAENQWVDARPDVRVQ